MSTIRNSYRIWSFNKKPGYVVEALNVDAIVRESPLPDRHLYRRSGGTTPESSEIS